MKASDIEKINEVLNSVLDRHPGIENKTGDFINISKNEVFSQLGFCDEEAVEIIIDLIKNDDVKETIRLYKD